MDPVTPANSEPVEMTTTMLLRELVLRHDRPGAMTALAWFQRGAPASVFAQLLDKLFNSPHFRFMAASLLAEVGDPEAEEMFHELAGQLNVAPIVPAAIKDQPFLDAPDCAEGRLAETFSRWLSMVKPWAEHPDQYRTTRLRAWPPRRYGFRLKGSGWRSGVQFAYSIDLRRMADGERAWRVFRMLLYQPGSIPPGAKPVLMPELGPTYMTFAAQVFPLWEDLPVRMEILPPMALRSEEAGVRLETWKTPVYFETAIPLDASPGWRPGGRIIT